MGDLYVYDTRSKAVSSKGSIVFFLKPKPKIPKLSPEASMADVTATMTKEVDFSIGLNLVSGFLEKFGISSIIGKIKVAYEAKGAKTIKFNFPKAIKVSVDAMHLGQNLINTKPIPNHPFYSKDNRYFLVMAVAKTTSITISVQDKIDHSADIDVTVLEQELINTKAKISKDNNSAVTFDGDKKLGFAVELQELKYDEKTKKISLKPTNEGVSIRGKLRKVKKRPAITDSIFLNLE